MPNAPPDTFGGSAELSVSLAWDYRRQPALSLQAGIEDAAKGPAHDGHLVLGEMIVER